MGNGLTILILKIFILDGQKEIFILTPLQIGQLTSIRTQIRLFFPLMDFKNMHNGWSHRKILILQLLIRLEYANYI